MLSLTFSLHILLNKPPQKGLLAVKSVCFRKGVFFNNWLQTHILVWLYSGMERPHFTIQSFPDRLFQSEMHQIMEVKWVLSTISCWLQRYSFQRVFTCPLENHSAFFFPHCPNMSRFAILFLLHIYMSNCLWQFWQAFVKINPCDCHYFEVINLLFDSLQSIRKGKIMCLDSFLAEHRL